MSITEILEKYIDTRVIGNDSGASKVIHRRSFPALERDLSQLLEDRAKEFAGFIATLFELHSFDFNSRTVYYVSANNNDGKLFTTSELYALFLTNKTKEE